MNNNETCTLDKHINNNSSGLPGRPADGTFPVKNENLSIYLSIYLSPS